MRMMALALFLCTLLAPCLPSHADQEQPTQEQVEQAELEAIRRRVQGYTNLRHAYRNLKEAEAAIFADAPLGEEPEITEAVQEMLDEAITLAEIAKFLMPELGADANLVIANCHWTMGDLEQTEAFYTAALDVDPARDDILSARVSVRILLEDWLGAERDIYRLAEIGSEFGTDAALEFNAARERQ